MNILDAIYQRRSVRSFTDAPVPDRLVRDLIRAATQAPSAVNEQPWRFAVVRGRDRLDTFSERAKSHLLAILPQSLSLHQRADALASDNYNVFHRAGTLVLICAKNMNPSHAEDCCLAAQNFMLAAQALGLGTCLIGFVRPWLNLPETKTLLGLPAACNVVVPLVVGWPASQPSAVPRHEPEIVSWIEDVPAAMRRGHAMAAL